MGKHHIPLLSLIVVSMIYGDTFENRNSHNIINTKKAWDMGITGAGITIGIVDSPVNDKHPFLDKKILNQKIYKNYQTQEYKPNFICNNQVPCDSHGSHVVGIAIGKNLKNPNNSANIDFLGVAHDAKAYVAAGIGNDKTQPEPIELSIFFNKQEVKIINNSWGSNIYPFINTELSQNNLIYAGNGKNDRNPTSLINTISSYWRGYSCDTCNTTLEKELISLARDHKVLITFAAGNEGIVSPSMQSVLPRYDESLKSWITVGAFDSELAKKLDSGKLDFTNKDALTSFSNLFYGAESWSILAPGKNISSANASDESSIEKSGTSMAAPFVSGAAALVAQKFPDLNGRQIADVLLSTANKNVQLPNMIVKQHTSKKYSVIYINNDASQKGLVYKNKEDVIKDVQDAGYKEEAGNIKTSDGLLKVPSNNKGDTQDAVYVLGKESIIGQGVLDIEKAMGGLARLDANRLTRDDIYTLNSNSILTKWSFTTGSKFTNTEHALYTLTVSDNNEMLFSNNIDERLWENNLHYSVNGVTTLLAGSPNTPSNPMTHFTGVGLLKDGLGTLVLSGQNTYTGLTYIKQGTLALMSEADFKNRNYTKPDISQQALNAAQQESNTPRQSNTIKQIAATNQNIATNLSKAPDDNTNQLITANTTKPLLSGSVYIAKEANLIGSGEIKNNLQNQGTLQVGNLAPVNPHGIQNKEGTNNDLIVGGTYTQDTDATLTLVFGEKDNAKLKAQHYVIKGGKLTFTPQKNAYFQGDGKRTIKIDLAGMPQNLFSSIQTKNTNSLNFDLINGIIIPRFADNAYTTANTSLAFTSTMKSIQPKSSLIPHYQQAFGQLDSLDMSLSAYTKAVDEIQGGGHLLASSEILNTQKRMLNEFSILPMNNALTPITSITTGLTTALN
ncbi:S8 family serine peptidase, partial [Helicobacter sp. 10-6591]|uniref:S8 family serine peptidase n=1 Tax=Helicobacter sp. 10-6591 TaxID=2004998 RepID=UPI000DCDA590